MSAIGGFVSAERLSTFEANPSQYVAQFGRFCTFGMASCYKADTQPDAWTIVHGKLSRNYGLAVRTEWNENQAIYLKKDNKNWTKEKQQ